MTRIDRPLFAPGLTAADAAQLVGAVQAHAGLSVEIERAVTLLRCHGAHDQASRLQVAWEEYVLPGEGDSADVPSGATRSFWARWYPEIGVAFLALVLCVGVVLSLWWRP